MLLPLNLIGALSDQVIHLVKTMVKMDLALTSVWGSLASTKKELEYLHPRNALVTQQLTYCMNGCQP